MHISDSRLDALQAVLQAKSVDVFLLPMADEFQGEYTPESAKRLPYVTGFDGSAGLGALWAVPSAECSHALFTDGRYILQAAQQVSARVAVINSGEKSLAQWLALQKKGLRIGFDPWLITHQQLHQWQDALQAHGAIWAPLTPNPVDAIWEQRPTMPTGEVVLHPLEFSGQSYSEKRQILLDAMASKNADAQLLTLPDGINWLLNIRGSDIPFNPLLLAYFILYKNGRGALMMQSRTLDASLSDFLREQGIDIVPVADIWHGNAAALSLPSGSNVLVDTTSSAQGWWQIAEAHGWKLVQAADPTLLPKSCKNMVELAGIRAAHQRDGLALSRFLGWLDGQVDAGKFPTELEVVDRLEAFRAADASYRGPSFATIAGSGPHGAIVHYRADAQSNRRLASGELFLLDSGGQYLDGTTDVTRTVAVGKPSDAMREHFTTVLKGHIALANARFPVGTAGIQLDALARQYLWAAGLDYDHGTGHGVGAYLCVHEGPQRISKKGSMVALQPGMIISNEPGYYKANAYGIRIENLVAVTADAQGNLGFDTLTLAPIDTRLVQVALLDTTERNWLNNYHRRVYETHAPMMEKRELAWLAHATRAI